MSISVLFKKSIVIIAGFLLILNITTACSDKSDDDESVTKIEISEIYGWTYKASFTSSSGTSLKPQLLIFNNERLDWNMSSNGLGTMQYWYTCESDGVNKYKLWWYPTKAEMQVNDKSKAALIVTLGIQKADQIKIIASAANAGAGSSMTGTVLSMTRTSDSKNTTPSDIQ